MICRAGERLWRSPPVAVTTAGGIRTSICRVVVYLQRDMSGDSCQLPQHRLCPPPPRPRSPPLAPKPLDFPMKTSLILFPPTASQMACPKTCSYRAAVGLGNKYVRLNVGGTLFYTTLQVLTRQDSVLKAMFSGRKEVFIDREGWILIDRSGKHFGSILTYLREEADQKEQSLCVIPVDQKEQSLCVIPVVTSAKEEERLIQACTKPVVKLLYNRNCLLSYNGRVLFIKDVIGDEICCWSFYGQTGTQAGGGLLHIHSLRHREKKKKKQTEVEFPEARIYEETLNALLYETLPVPDDALLEATRPQPRPQPRPLWFPQ
ncbi:unnamed protein product, partial [Coregonus sp. 'balchen']